VDVALTPAIDGRRPGRLTASLTIETMPCFMKQQLQNLRRLLHILFSVIVFFPGGTSLPADAGAQPSAPVSAALITTAAELPPPYCHETKSASDDLNAFCVHVHRQAASFPDRLPTPCQTTPRGEQRKPVNGAIRRLCGFITPRKLSPPASDEDLCRA